MHRDASERPPAGTCGTLTGRGCTAPPVLAARSWGTAMDDFDDALSPDAADGPSEELAALAREAVEAQSGAVDSSGARRRCQRVIDLYAQGHIQDGRDNFHAAWVMLCGETQGHFGLA